MENLDEAASRPPLVVIGVVSVLAVLVVSGAVYMATDRWTDMGAMLTGTGEALASVTTPERQTIAMVQERTLSELRGKQEQERLAAKTRAERLVAAADKALADVAEAAAELERWGSEVEPLLTNDAGKRIAAREDQVVTFAAVYDSATRPSAGDFQATQFRIEGMRDELRRVADSGEAAFSEESEDKIAEELAGDAALAGEMLGALRSDCRAIDAIVASAAQSPAVVTLGHALQELRRRWAAERAAKVEAAMEVKRLAADQAVAALEARKFEEIESAKRRLREAELERERMRIDTEAEAREEQTKHERLKMLAESPAIREKYKPLLTAGKTKPYNNNPGGPGTLTWTSTNKLEAEFVSLSDIKRANALSSFEDFVRLLTSTANDRSSWPLAASDETTAEYRKRFEEFRTLAPLWIEAGILRP